MLHGHSMNAFLATLLDPHASEFRVTHIEMIKGIVGQVRRLCLCLRPLPCTACSGHLHATCQWLATAALGRSAQVPPQPAAQGSTWP